MTLAALIRKRTTEVATATPAIPATPNVNSSASVAKIATIAVANQQARSTLDDSASNERRDRVLAILEESAGVTYAVVCDGQGEPVPIAIAIRGVGTCEVLVPSDRYDGLMLLDILERHSGTVH